MASSDHEVKNNSDEAGIQGFGNTEDAQLHENTKSAEINGRR